MANETDKAQSNDGNKIKYSVIIPAYNEEKFLPETLSRLKMSMDSIHFNGEIIVADNNSSDNTGTIARQHGARVVFEPVRQISRARNCGASVAKGDYLIFLDADTVLPQQLLQKTINLLETNSYCGGGTLISFDSELPFLANQLARLWNWISRSGQLAAGSFVFCLSQAFQAIGGFDETVYAGEEIFLSRKLKNWGNDNGTLFTIIEDHSVITSGRKFHWYSSLQLLLLLLLFTFFPVAFRYKTLCSFWYTRPDN